MLLDQWPADEGSLRSLMPASLRLKHFYRHLILWVLQAWLAMFFIGAAFAKLSQPYDILAYLLTWPVQVDHGMVQLVGAIELALAIGLLTPLVSWRLFRTVVRVAAGLLVFETLVMAAYHLTADQLGLAALNAVLAVMAVAILIGRRPLTARVEMPA